MIKSYIQAVYIKTTVNYSKRYESDILQTLDSHIKISFKLSNKDTDCNYVNSILV